MKTSESTLSTQIKVGLFSLLGILLVGGMTVFVNDKPFWWRRCQLVHINVDDATGLKSKSPVRSLGLEIGYLSGIELSETHVRLGICITAPVEVLSTTKAYLRGEGFLGDKFVELKPVKYLGPRAPSGEGESSPGVSPTEGASPQSSRLWREFFGGSAFAADPSLAAPAPAASVSPSASPVAVDVKSDTNPKRRKSQDIPVGEKSQDMQHLVNQVDGLVSEMTKLTGNLREALKPEELRSTMLQLNKTLENASKLLSPEGGLNTTAQRTLAKLEDAIEQMRDMMTRVNHGEGSLGMLLNDPVYAEEIRKALENINRILNRVAGSRFVINLGAEKITANNGTRGFFQLGIWPEPSRYYLIGASMDPRGKKTTTTTKTTAGGITSTTQTEVIEDSALLFTVMLGKVFWKRLDLSAGILHGDGSVSSALNLGPVDSEERFIVRLDTFARSKASGGGLDGRLTGQIRPFAPKSVLSPFYVRGGLDALRKVDGQVAWSYGAGITFDDQDISVLFAIR